ncbi:hypothetical protein Zmor_003660 [Zophobas morio]|uniref:Uncharacterized protein n=1 Tax=Zophobas morio TaxID=2755281 RepID=A0AA38M1H1_9CUCU|nr:hypothetical protein Zmor_003660 [Zophobas morio]
MNLKNSITEFREFQRVRRTNRLLKKKMLNFVNVRYQRGEKQPINDVRVIIRSGLPPDLGVITFRAGDFQGYVGLEDVETYNDRGVNIAELLLIFEDEENIKLTFPTVTQKQEFAAALKKCLGLSNRSTPDPGLPLPIA